MSGGIYLLGNDKRLVEMKETAYDSEDLLQELLASYPSLLAGDQIDQTTPRKWVLISREMGIPDDEEGGDRWSVDHLFLDQDAIPTLVEVKRASDARMRAEHPGRIRARKSLANAIRGGRLVVGPCQACDLEPLKVNGRQRIQAHHHRGYSEEHQLDVQWLCRRCHSAADAG